jgi:hypothetical protein
MSYTLKLTEADCETISFVGFRYAWSEYLEKIAGIEPGRIEISESDAWELAEAFQADMVGGHRPFPMLDYDSELARKLFEFWGEIV